MLTYSKINQMKKAITLFLLTLFTISCESKKEINEYLHDIDQELSPLKGDTEKVRVLYNRESLRYDRTGDKKYFYSSKLIEPALYADARLKQIPLVYNLLSINNGKYDFITVFGNYNLASQFESSSPDWSLQCIEKAISTAEKSNDENYLAHLYHFKGRLLFNKNHYTEAIKYFEKALQLYESQNKILYVSSMHNNFGMCYEAMNQLDRAIKEVNTGIKILANEKDKSKQNLVFLNYLKGVLAHYMIQKKNFPYAEQLLLDMWKFSLGNDNHRMALNASKDLIEIYKETDQNQKIPQIVDSLSVIEPHLILAKNKITLNELAQDYYAEKNDYENFGLVAKKLVLLNKDQNDFNKKELKINFDIADNYIIKNVQQQRDSEKRKNQLLLLCGSLALIFLLLIVIYLARERKKKEKIMVQNKLISENNQKILQQNIELQKEKIRNLHLNLNLKSETERAFLENLKKMKRSKASGSDEIVKDLQFKVNNLIHIDKKNNDLMDESSQENKEFIQNLSLRYPTLTKQELKLCVYFRLQLSAKEISLLEKFTAGSIRVYKTKIKSKIGLEKEEDLVIFLKNFNPKNIN